MTHSRRATLAALLAPAAATAGDEPELEVTGAIAPPAPRMLRRSAVEAIGARELVTRTPWTTGMQVFGGVPLAALLEALGTTGSSIRAVALNDYAATIPVSDAHENGAFLATRLAGQPLPVRLRGPFWLVYPWSQRPELEAAVFRQRAIWQLHRIEIG